MKLFSLLGILYFFYSCSYNKIVVDYTECVINDTVITEMIKSSVKKYDEVYRKKAKLITITSFVDDSIVSFDLYDKYDKYVLDGSRFYHNDQDKCICEINNVLVKFKKNEYFDYSELGKKMNSLKVRTGVNLFCVIYNLKGTMLSSEIVNLTVD